MIRDINFTGRHSLDNCYTVVCRKGPPSDPKWTVSVKLDAAALGKFSLPDTARCLVDVYLGSRQEQFVMGEGMLRNRWHDEFRTQMSNDIYFKIRLKIVDALDPNRKILAAKLQISPETMDMNGCKEPLLPVEYNNNIGPVPWRLLLDDPAHGARPVLVVNSALKRGSRNADAIVKHDPMFVALVLPEVYRRILMRFIVEAEEIDGEERWVTGALKTMNETIDKLQEADRDERVQFVDAVVAKFCEENDFLVLGEEADE